MLGPLNGQLPAGIVVHDFRDAAEGWAVLAQHVLVFLGPGQLHVHEALTALEGQGEIILAGLTVAHQVAGLFAQAEQVLGICSTDGPVVPAGFPEAVLGLSTPPGGCWAPCLGA